MCLAGAYALVGTLEEIATVFDGPAAEPEVFRRASVAVAETGSASEAITKTDEPFDKIEPH